MKEPGVFHFDDERVGFEDHALTEGELRFWYARDLMTFLEYKDFRSFEGVINRAVAACASLNINIMDNFTQVRRDYYGEMLKDYKLTRFACYLIAMNGDSKKEQVARAQVYFAALAESVRYFLDDSENVERLFVRGEISEHETSLSAAAYSHEVKNYSFFQNAGYRGMYNLNLKELKQYKQLEDVSRSLLDFMGRDELAANLFRLTQTETKIKNDDIRGQTKLEDAAETVGRQVREAMIAISGTVPEDLPLVADINDVKKELKQAHKKLISGKKPENLNLSYLDDSFDNEMENADREES